MAKTVEIDEEEYARLHKIGQTLGAIMAHPEASVLAEKAAKTVFPDAKTPNLDRIKQREESESGLKKTVDELRAELAADKADREKNAKIAELNSNVEKGLDALRRDGWTKQGIDGVRALMDEKGIIDPFDAAAIYEKQHPPQSLLTPGGSGQWNFMEPPPDDQVNIQKLIASRGENDQIVDLMSREALAEMRGQQVRR